MDEFEAFRSRLKQEENDLSKLKEMPVTNRYIAVCDILGFKGLIKREGLVELNHHYTYLLSRAFVHMGVSPLAREVFTGSRPDELGYAVFSDTILIWSAAIDRSALSVHHATEFFYAAANLLNNASTRIPMRAGIAYGEVLINPRHSLYMGQPIVDAHLLEMSQNWIGGACDSSCHLAPGFHEACMESLVLWEEVPLKRGLCEMFALNWPPGINSGTYDDAFTTMRTEAPLEAKDKYDESLKFAKKYCYVPWRSTNRAWHAPDEKGKIVVHPPLYNPLK